MGEKVRERVSANEYFLAEFFFHNEEEAPRLTTSKANEDFLADASFGGQAPTDLAVDSFQKATASSHAKVKGARMTGKTPGTIVGIDAVKLGVDGKVTWPIRVTFALSETSFVVVKLFEDKDSSLATVKVWRGGGFEKTRSYWSTKTSLLNVGYDEKSELAKVHLSVEKRARSEIKLALIELDNVMWEVV